MIDKKLKEAMDLLGGKAVIKDGDECFILLSLKEFRKIKQEGVSGLTKQELIDKINNDIASWKFSLEESRMDSLDLKEIGEIKIEGEEGEDGIHYEKTD